MHSFRSTFLTLLLVLTAHSAYAQDKAFPTDTEIDLVMTQTDRAIQQYKPLIDMEAIQLGEAGKEAIAKDRQVVQALELAVKTFRTNPQGFNTPVGFAFFEWLDDAGRNAMLCQTLAVSQSSVFMMAGESSTANALIHLATSCRDASTLFYTISENAGALYQRYIEGEQSLAQKGVDVAQRCGEALKKLTPAKR